MAKQLKINLQNLPPAARIAVALIPAVVIIVIFYFLVYSANAKEIRRLKTKIVGQEKEIAKNEAKIAKLPEVKKKYAELEFRLKVLSQQLPEEKEISNLLKQISDQAVKSGLSIRLWKPSARTKHSTNVVYVIPVKVTMSGTFHSLGEFFSRLTAMDRIVNIKDIQLKKKKKKGTLGLLEISFAAQTFSAVPESERPGGKKRK